VRTLELNLEDALVEELENVSARQQRDAASIASELVRRYLESERARQTLQSSSLIALYGELAEEDVALAEAGMTDYSVSLKEADQEGLS